MGHRDDDWSTRFGPYIAGTRSSVVRRGWIIGSVVAAAHLLDTVLTLALGRYWQVPAWILFSVGAGMGVVLAAWIGWMVARVKRG